MASKEDCPRCAVSKKVRCLAPDCYELFNSPDPCRIRICDKCRPNGERVCEGRLQPHEYEIEEDEDESTDGSLEGCPGQCVPYLGSLFSE